MFVLELRGRILITSIQATWCGAKWRQQVVEQRDRGVRIDGGAIPEGLFPSGLKNRSQVLAHPLRGMGVQAAHPGNLRSEPLLRQNLRNAILSHPRLVAMPQAMRRQTAPDRQPAG